MLTETAPRILILCNSRGRMLDACLQFEPIRNAVWGVFSDHDSESLQVAKAHGLAQLVASDPASQGLSDRLLSLCELRNIDFIISTGFTRILKGNLLKEYPGAIFNTHFSLLPAFAGRKGSDWTADQFPPRAIFERAMAFGARFIGNTVHAIDETIDGGAPLMQSVLSVSYDHNEIKLRHQLYVQECKCLMQTIMWLSERRVELVDGKPRVIGAQFDEGPFCPAIEQKWISDFMRG